MRYWCCGMNEKTTTDPPASTQSRYRLAAAKESDMLSSAMVGALEGVACTQNPYTSSTADHSSVSESMSISLREDEEPYRRERERGKREMRKRERKDGRKHR